MGGELVKDFNQTISMLRHPFGRSIQLSKKILRKRNRFAGPKTGRDMLRATRDAWLEERYGWGPIILDMDSILRESAQIGIDKGSRRVARASDQTSVAQTKAIDVYMIPGYQLRGVGEVTANYKSSVHCGVIYDVESESRIEALNRVMGFRPRDIPATVLECIPYSFVADWFWNIGDWLQAIVPVPGVKIQGQWTTTVVEKNFRFPSGQLILGWNINNPPPATYYGTYPARSIKDVVVTRNCQPLSATLTPTWTGKPISGTHAVDAMALFGRQVYDGLKSLKH
jgi:hypothetical protein